jgi:AraC family transcriptional regulator
LRATRRNPFLVSVFLFPDVLRYAEKYTICNAKMELLLYNSLRRCKLDWQNGMSQAIDYIESNLTETVDFDTAAGFVGCSSWEFQRIFSFLTRVPLGEYIRQRKLTLAARDILTDDAKIIDIALKYGYESPAAFSRAFSKLFGITPSSARGAGGLDLNAYPRITLKMIEKERITKLTKFNERGYVVRENAPVYFTRNMEKTIK